MESIKILAGQGHKSYDTDQRVIGNLLS